MKTFGLKWTKKYRKRSKVKREKMKKILMKSIRFYQKNISPATQPSCRYHPTCSTYALRAIEKHGALKGGIMGTARILRCNPFVEGGVDKVPDHFTLRRNPKNVGEQYIPDYLLSVDMETKKEIKELLEKYREKLVVNEKLKASLASLEEFVELEELSLRDLKEEFSPEEFSYIEDIDIIPDLEDEDFRYFTLSKNSMNEEYLKEMHSFDEGILLGEDYPLIVTENTGIWYTNLPRLLNQFLIHRGVTRDDLKNNSYHLWMVLKALEKEN